RRDPPRARVLQRRDRAASRRRGDPCRNGTGGRTMTLTNELTKLVLVEHRDGVLTITINRPAQKNAINHAVAEQLGAALDRLDEDPGRAAGGLTGAGGTFSAGMDLKAFAAGELPVLPGRGFGGLTRARIKKPLI